jgi:hypothetical protein
VTAHPFLWSKKAGMQDLFANGGLGGTGHPDTEMIPRPTRFHRGCVSGNISFPSPIKVPRQSSLQRKKNGRADPLPFSAINNSKSALTSC